MIGKFMCKAGIHDMKETTTDTEAAWGCYSERCSRCGYRVKESNR